MKFLLRLSAVWLLVGITLFSLRPLAAQSAPGSERAEHAEAGRAPDKSEAEADENDVYRKSPMVRSMGAKMGMTPDRAASTFEVVNFAVLAVLLGWLLLKALPTAFRNRNTVIQKDLVDARTATEEAKARLGSVEARLAGLDAQIAGMKAQAEKDLVAEEQRIRASVEEERQRILQAADQEIAAATVVARRELQRLAVELAIGQASRKLEISAETDRLLVQNFARQLGADEGRGGSN